jgi:hypothetical protein
MNRRSEPGEQQDETARCIEEERRINANGKFLRVSAYSARRTCVKNPLLKFFRDKNRIAAYCESHVTAIARRIGITLAMYVNDDFSDVPIHRRFWNR